MIFDKPTSFAEAIASRKTKALMPTTMSSAELAKLDAELLERSLFAARVDNAQVLQTLDEVVESIINPQQETREGVTVQVGDTLTSGKAKLRQTLDAIDYQPPEGKEGTIESVSSEQRMELMIRMQVQFSEGYGDWKQGQQRDVLDMWPAVELRRIAPREVPRGTDEGIPNRYWQTRWELLGGRLYNGRMICPKNDPIMSKVSLFGIPYGPPGFNSGYDWRDVGRAEAERLGVIAPGQRIAQQERNFMTDTRASVAKLSQALKDELLAEMGEGYAIEDDALGYSSGGSGRVADYGNERLVSADYKPNCPRVRAHGLNIVIENEKGSERSGVDPNGKSWKVAMPADYGELHGFKGADGDYVDCYVGEVESAEVHVVDQRNIFGAGNEFDEHKCFVNFPSANVARETYLAGYTDGRGAERIAGMTTMSVDEFKAWLRDKAKTKKPTLQAVNEMLIANLAHGVV